MIAETSSNYSSHTPSHRKQILASESLKGLRLATLIRLAALVTISLLLILLQPSPASFYNVAILSLFAIFGMAHYMFARSRLEHPLYGYLFMLLDVTLLTFVLIGMNRLPALNPLIFEGLYPEMMFQYSNFVYYFWLVALVSLSYSPGLILWTGFLSAFMWSSGVLWLTIGQDAWSGEIASVKDIIYSLIDGQYVSIIPRGAEVASILLVSILLALLTARARNFICKQDRVSSRND